MFAGSRGIRAKIRVYDESVQWVLERQRQELDERISGLETEDLRQVLQEAALCVVQSGNETAKLTMLKSRFTDSANPVAELLKQAQTETEKTEGEALNNLLTAFYLKPGEGDRSGSVEFAHKSFGEFLFAERLRCAFEDWVEVDKRGRFRLNDSETTKQIYDLLGYGSLTNEIFEYLKELLFSKAEPDAVVQLFQRLHNFYENWSEGTYINKALGENLPQNKMVWLVAAEIKTGLRQVDIYTGLNVMVLLFELHRRGWQLDSEQSKNDLNFHSCRSADLDSDSNPEIDGTKLLRLIGYSQLIRANYFLSTVGYHLCGANLSCVILNHANLNNANLRHADLSNADLSCVDLSDATLNYANLSATNLGSANLSYANLSNADLSAANLRSENLRSVNLNDADLVATNLSYADLGDAALRSTDLSYANLSAANLSTADLSSANLSYANFRFTDLEDVRFNEETNWNGVKGLDTAKNVATALKQQLGLT